MALPRIAYGLAGIVGIVALVGLAALVRDAPAFGDQNVAGDAWSRVRASTCVQTSDGVTVSSARFGTRTHANHCLDSGTLQTYTCVGGGIQSSTTDCAYGCTDGVCTPAPTGTPLFLRGAQIAQVTVGGTGELVAQRYYYPVELVARPVLIDDGVRQYLLTSASTDLCRSDKNFLTTDITFTDCSQGHVSALDLYAFTDAVGHDHLADNGDRAPWRRNYGGVTSATVTGTGANRKVIGVVHGENQNAMEEGVFYPNTVRHPISENTSCYSSSENGWQHCWESFSSFVSLVWWSYDDFLAGAPAHDLGPVVWNPRRYDTDGGGPYHPTMFVDGNRMYVYYNSWPSSGTICDVAARATIGADGMPGPFRNHAGNGRYPAGRFALPSGLTTANVQQYYDTTVPYPSCLVDEPEYNGVWFSVARIRGTPYYLNAEERIRDAWNPDPQQQIAQVVLRISDDPGNWTGSPEIVIEEKSGGWGVLEHTYPTFVDKEGTTTMEIDPAEFYLIGNDPAEGYRARSTALRLSFPVIVAEE